MFGKIAVLFDFSWTSRLALDWAVRMGSRFYSSVSVLHALSREENREDIEKRIRQEVDDKTRQLGSEAPLSSVSVHVHSGRAIRTLLAAIEADAPDLVILGTHGQTGLLHVLLGSVAEKIIRHSPSPTLVIKRTASWPPRNVLLPISFDDDVFEETLLAASELRTSLGVSLDLLHVVEPPRPLAYPPEAAIGWPVFDSEIAVREGMGKLRLIAERHLALSLVPHTTVGQAAHEICLAAARSGTDIILLPTHGRSGANRLFLGSVAEQVVRYAPCNVLTFRPGRFGMEDHAKG